jgi:hypothetical protein
MPIDQVKKDESKPKGYGSRRRKEFLSTFINQIARLNPAKMV